MEHVLKMNLFDYIRNSIRLTSDVSQENLTKLSSNVSQENLDLRTIYLKLLNQQKRTGSVTKLDLFKHIKPFISEEESRKILYSIVFSSLKFNRTKKNKIHLLEKLNLMSISDIENLLTYNVLTQMQELNLQEFPLSQEFSTCDIKEKKYLVTYFKQSLLEKGYSTSCLEIDENVFISYTPEIRKNKKLRWNLAEPKTKIVCSTQTPIFVNSKNHDLWFCNEDKHPIKKLHLVHSKFSVDGINSGKYYITCKDHPQEHDLELTTYSSCYSCSSLCTTINKTDTYVIWNLMQSVKWPQTLKIKTGTHIKFISDDNLQHCIQLANTQYEALPIKPLISDTNFSYEHVFTKSGRYILIDKMYPTSIRMFITVLPETKPKPEPEPETEPETETETETETVNVFNVLPKLPEPYVYSEDFIQYFEKWLIIDYAMKDIGLSSQVECLNPTSDLLKVLQEPISIKGILLSESSDKNVKQLKNRISTEIISSLTNDKLEDKALNLWFKYDKDNVIKALTNSIQENTKSLMFLTIDQQKLQTLAEKRLSEMPHLRRNIKKALKIQ